MSKVYAIVQERIVNELKKAIETGSCAPWEKPWIFNSVLMNHVTENKYKGINRILLPQEGEYLTMKQISDLHAKDPKIKLKKGSKSDMVVKWVFSKGYKNNTQDTGIDNDDDDETSKKEYATFVYHRVYHISCVEGLSPKVTLEKFEHDTHEEAERIIKAFCDKYQIKFNVVKGGSNAFCNMKKEVYVPDKSQFKNLSEYYSTIFHELTHASGLILGRDMKGHKFGDKDYSKEELVAEIGSNFILSSLGLLEEKSAGNSVSYLRSWLKVIQDDMFFITSASQQAEKAANLILGLEAIA